MDKENQQYTSQYTFLNIKQVKRPRGRILSDVDVNSYEKQTTLLRRNLTPVPPSKPTRIRSDSSYERAKFPNFVFPTTSSQQTQIQITEENKKTKSNSEMKITINFNGLPRKSHVTPCVNIITPVVNDEKNSLSCGPATSINRAAYNSRKSIDLQVSTFNKRPQTFLFNSKSERQTSGREDLVNKYATKMTLSSKYYKILSSDHTSAYVVSNPIEILKDICRNPSLYDSKYILRKNFLSIYNHSSSNRNDVINWLYMLQNHLGVHSSIIFTSVRLFDYVICRVYMSEDLLQLVAITSFWMLHKFDNSRQPFLASNLVRFCKGLFTKNHILDIELKLFKIFNYNVNVPDVTLFIEYYSEFNFYSDNNLVKLCATYILECYMFTAEFSTLPPYYQAIVAVKLALDITSLKKHTWNQLNFVPKSLDHQDLQAVASKMIEQLYKVQNVEYKYREPYLKYSKAEYLRVSLLVSSRLSTICKSS